MKMTVNHLVLSINWLCVLNPAEGQPSSLPSLGDAGASGSRCFPGEFHVCLWARCCQHAACPELVPGWSCERAGRHSLAGGRWCSRLYWLIQEFCGNESSVTHLTSCFRLYLQRFRGTWSLCWSCPHAVPATSGLLQGLSPDTGDGTPVPVTAAPPVGHPSLSSELTGCIFISVAFASWRCFLKHQLLATGVVLSVHLFSVILICFLFSGFLCISLKGCEAGRDRRETEEATTPASPTCPQGPAQG